MKSIISKYHDVIIYTWRNYMEKKIIFFDVDGTLVSDTGGIEHVPESAKRAIALTRAKGNLVYLCTGRSKG